MKLLPYLLLGPLTGPLTYGFVHYHTHHRPFMAGVCLLGIAEVWSGLALTLLHNLTALL